MSKVSANEVAAVLREAIAGKIAVECANPNIRWNDAMHATCDFRFESWTLTFFNDAGELDYTEKAVSPYGREGDFESWADEIGNCPLSLLRPEEVDQVKKLLETAI